MCTLPELQARFMRGILDADFEASVPLIRAQARCPAERIGIYANNAATHFEESLRLSFPVVLRLVGNTYFSQCVSGYRRRHPSRSGDLQNTGASFAEFMGDLHRQGEFRYLEDLARLEWLYQEALVAADHGPLDLRRLAAVPPGHYDELRFSLHPAARLFASDFPALEIWEANIGTEEPGVIDLSQGGERVLLTRTRGRLEFYRLEHGEHRFLEALQSNATFATALGCALDCDARFDPGSALRRFAMIHAIVNF